jgi:hypothetical protein
MFAIFGFTAEGGWATGGFPLRFLLYPVPRDYQCFDIIDLFNVSVFWRLVFTF